MQQRAEIVKSGNEERIEREREFRGKLDKLVAAAGSATSPQLPVTWPTQLKGKALIWDAVTNQPSPAQDKLPSELRGTLDDKDLTVFLVTGKNTRLAGTLRQQVEPMPNSPPRSGSSVTAYRIRLDVFLADPLSGQVNGPISIYGRDPTFLEIPPAVASGQQRTWKTEADPTYVSNGQLTGGYAEELATWVKWRFGPPSFYDRYFAAEGSDLTRMTQELMTSGGRLNEINLLPQLAAKLRRTSGDSRYQIISVMQDPASPGVKGPANLEEFRRDPDQWTRQWAEWAEKQSSP